MALTGFLVFSVLGALFAGDQGFTQPDRALADLIEPMDTGLLWALVQPTEPYVLLPVLALIILASALRKDWTAVIVTVTAPALAVALSSFAFKPAFGRFYEDHLAYPSGHTVSLVATLTLLALLLRKTSIAVLSVLITVVAGIGMIGLRFHYATDVLGGAGLAVTVTIVVNSAVQSWRREPGPSADSPPAGTSSDSRPGSSPR